MKIIAFETSCDDTAVAVVEDGRRVLSNCVASQIELHLITSGVVPEVAARQHTEMIYAVTKEALDKSGLKWSEIDAVAVTAGPGLLSSLVVGYSFAKGLAMALKKPLDIYRRIFWIILRRLSIRFWL